MAVKGDKVYLKAKPQFFQPAGEPIAGFYRNGSVPNDSIVNDWIEDNYNDCSFLGEVKIVQGKTYYLVRLNFSYQKHGFLGIAKTVKSSEDLWFLEQDVSFEYVDTAEDIKEQKKQALQASLLSDAEKDLTANADTTTGNGGSNIIYIAIAGVIVVLIGVIWWALGKKKNPTAPPASTAPTIVMVPKPKANPIKPLP